MPTDILADIIDMVLNRASSIYFNYELVQEHQEFCAKCGNCCKDLNCEHFNGRTCDEYGSRFDACKEFPAYDILNETGLVLDCECQLANMLAKMILDEEFQKNLNLLALD